MESVEEHTKAWIMREEVELVTLPECVKSVRSLILRRMHKLIYCVNTQPKSAFHDKMQTSVCLLFMTYILMYPQTHLLIPLLRLMRNIMSCFRLDTKTSQQSIYCRFFYLFNKRTAYNYDTMFVCSQRGTTMKL